MRKRFIPNQDKIFFSAKKKYKDFNWNDFDEVIDAFKLRMDEWYFTPIQNLKDSGHYGFPITALTCLLVDTISQYYYGELKGSGNIFKKFLRRNFNLFKKRFSTSIKVPRVGHPGSDDTLHDFADVLYTGFRCGILHEAQFPLCCLISGQKKMIKYYSKGYTKYIDGSDCPSVVIDPRQFFDTIHKFYIKYLEMLKDPKHKKLRNRFRKKVIWNFGLDIGK